jgi:hypothetical protein
VLNKGLLFIFVDSVGGVLTRLTVQNNSTLGSVRSGTLLLTKTAKSLFNKRREVICYKPTSSQILRY